MDQVRETGSGDLRDVRGGGALVALHDVELDAIALGEALETRAIDCRMVHEAILAAVLRRNESETLAVVEPLYFTGAPHHVCSLSFRRCVADRKRASGSSGPLLSAPSIH